MDAAWLRRAFTLLVPTYQRPGDLRRLVTFLARQRAPFAVHVLDSSQDGIAAQNRAVVGAVDLDIRYRGFPPDTAPFEKFAQGAAAVDTPFAALCADDDLVLPGAIAALTGHLAAHSGVAAAHGWYFGFQAGDPFELLQVTYRGPSIRAAGPLDRLRALLGRYEALTYAVHRSGVLAEALAGVARLDGILFREIGAGALTVIAGPVERLPLLHYGRAHGQSLHYRRWHPVEAMLADPAGLVAEYGRYRAVILAALAGCDAERPPDEAAAVVDLCHLRYLAGYLSPAVLDAMIDVRMAGQAGMDHASPIWPLLHPTGSRLLDGVRRLRLAHWAKRRLDPRLWRFVARFARKRARTPDVIRRTAAGQPRRYRLAPPFGEALAALPDGRTALGGLLDALDAFE